MQFSYEITPRPNDLGGGWRLRLLQDGVEMGAGCSQSNKPTRTRAWPGGTR